MSRSECLCSEAPLSAYGAATLAAVARAALAKGGADKEINVYSRYELRSATTETSDSVGDNTMKRRPHQR